MTNPSSIPLADRVARYLLRRLERQAIRVAYESAERSGLLARHAVSDENAQNGLICWRVQQTLPLALTGNAEVDCRILERLLKRRHAVTPEPSDDFAFEDDGERPVVGHTLSGQPVRGQRLSAKSGKAGRGSSSRRAMARSDFSSPVISDTESADERAPTSADVDGTAGHQGAERDYMLRLIRSLGDAPHVADVAVAMLLASAVGDAFDDIDPVLAVLRRRAPVVVIRTPVSELEYRLGTMLERGLVMPFALRLIDAFGDRSLSGSYRDNPADPHRAASISGKTVQAMTARAVREAVTNAFLRKKLPIVVVDETAPSGFPQRLLAGADMILETGGLDRSLLADLFHVCLGVPPKISFNAMETRSFWPGKLGLDDLALAVRPGRSVEEILLILTELSAANETERDETGDEFEGRSRKIGQGSREKPGNLSRKRSGGSYDLTQPDKPPSEEISKTSTTKYLSVESLAGYGKAKDWALDLKSDLRLWRQDGLSWSDMSTKLLLSGPPGTGKTTFARVLCNTLQVPLLATSLSTMLEPGYLGDVLQAMSAAFETAREHAPSILFIDELDNIGRRSNGGGRNDEYWNSLINRLLELLDGVAKTEGVIVVAATNLPDRIDPALLRSGRLETHIEVPPPDIAALAGILEHHLGSDLATVIGSRPKLDAEPNALERLDGLDEQHLNKRNPTGHVEMLPNKSMALPGGQA